MITRGVRLVLKKQENEHSETVFNLAVFGCISEKDVYAFGKIEFSFRFQTCHNNLRANKSRLNR